MGNFEDIKTGLSLTNIIQADVIPWYVHLNLDFCGFVRVQIIQAEFSWIFGDRK